MIRRRSRGVNRDVAPQGVQTVGKVRDRLTQQLRVPLPPPAAPGSRTWRTGTSPSRTCTSPVRSHVHQLVHQIERAGDGDRRRGHDARREPRQQHVDALLADLEHRRDRSVRVVAEHLLDRLHERRAACRPRAGTSRTARRTPASRSRMCLSLKVTWPSGATRASKRKVVVHVAAPGGAHHQVFAHVRRRRSWERKVEQRRSRRACIRRLGRLGRCAVCAIARPAAQGSLQTMVARAAAQAPRHHRRRVPENIGSDRSRRTGPRHAVRTKP